MSTDSTAPGELILHRPRTLTTGAGRTIRMFLDDRQVADLEPGATARVPAAPGPHQLRARCMPLTSGEFTFILAAGEKLRVLVYVTALDELEIELDDEPDHSAPPR